LTDFRLSTALSDRYRIERELGAGGMATVYLAHDVKHDRRVALKVLKPELGAVLGVERFLAEIRVTANLQHPNLLPLFDSGEADGLLFYVMPFVEGESLRARLDREKQLPVDEVIRISSAIGSALAFAHDRGVIHRDLKPENVLLQAGQPVIADFGIALAVSQAGGQRVTQTGLSLGTPQYMSPEQATGDRTIDARSDIYSLGAMTYEMLVGDPPHLGSTAQAIIAKVLTERPPSVLAARPAAGDNVADAIERALEKLPADRWSSAAEFVEALRGKASPNPTRARMRAVQGKSSTSRLRDPVVIALAALAVSLGGVAALQWRAARRGQPQPVIRFAIDLPRYVATGLSIGAGISVSEDGRTIAYIGGSPGSARQMALLRALDDTRSRPIPGTEDTQSIFLSPDGRWLGFWTKGRLSKVPLDGGAPVLLTDSITSFVGGSWSSRGVIVVSAGGQLMTIPDSGGALEPVSPSSTEADRQHYPVVLSDGETILYTHPPRSGGAGTRIGVASLRTGQAKPLDLVGTHALGVVDKYLLYATSTNQLMAVRWDQKTANVSGTPTQVATISPVAGGRAMSIAAVSASGALAFQSGSRESEMVLVDRRGVVRPLLPEHGVYGYPRFSPDGKRVAVTIDTDRRRDVWLYERDGGALVRLTENGMSERPEFTPDGRRVIYRTTDRISASAIWWRPTDRSAPATPVFTSANQHLWEALMTPDGKDFLLQRDDALLKGGADVVLRSASGDSTFVSVAATAAEETQARPSPDGQWVAFQSNASGINQVIVQPLRVRGGQVVVSPGFGTEPVWSRDGKRLFYRDATQLMEVSFTTSPEFVVTSRTPLFADPFIFAQAPHANYDVSPDGMTFVALRPTEGIQLEVVHNWGAELRRLTTPRPQ
jgi:eukaryotic-like serine/threonine-protein kinase